MRHNMGAELAVAIEMRSFDQQVQVQIAEHRREAIGVVELLPDAAPIHEQPIGKPVRPAVDAGDKQPVRVHELALAGNFAGASVDHRDRSRARQHRPHAKPASGLVHAKVSKRVAVPRRDDRLDLRIGARGRLGYTPSRARLSHGLLDLNSVIHQRRQSPVPSRRLYRPPPITKSLTL